MNTEILCYFLLIGFTVLGISTNSLSFNPIRFHCDNYVLNTYLYFILSWGIVMATNSTLSNSNVKLNDLFSGPFTILIFLGSLVLLMSLLFVPPKMFFTKHLLYISFIVLLGIFLYPYYITNKQLFHHVGGTTLLMFVVLSVIAFAYPQMISDGWGIYLFIALIGLLIARIMELFVKFDSKKSRIISYISVIVFSLYIMYDTKKIIVNAKQCVNPDYINESINLFLDSINLFQNNYLLSRK